MVPQPQHKKLPKEALEALAQKSDYFYRVFKSPDGQKVLQALEGTFDLDDIFVAGDPYQTSYNLGSRDVVIYIKQLLRMKENAARTE
jgi:hypothetical protein